ncbi:hypothetical protein PQU92_13085 [Asticcacaulis sp. BYS171W]|uniref:Uncharacterized protein n=1 Tax=Asticcacaulis aquaticus TaxID=2984212 RepID=A0ABT5HW69_9CAUL|nr:hypothetical protein [Asticcacaulis aquaticus]MDC7684219.1 hypothetical protein [Asticcacaulis aquaticus]
MKLKSIAYGAAVAMLSASGAHAATSAETDVFTELSQWIAGFFSAQNEAQTEAKSETVTPAEYGVNPPEDFQQP